MSSKQWICGCVLVLAVITAAPAATFFVDGETGDDSNAGTSAAKPFATIQTAIKVAAARPGPDVIQVAADRYEENLSIKDADSLILSGSPGVDIVAKDPSQDVINVRLGDITISDVKVSGGLNGIYAKGAIDAPIYLTVRNVESTANVERGLRADDALEVWVSACTIFDNPNDDGIKVQTKKLDRTCVNLSIRDTIVSGCGDDGIDLEAINDIRLTNVLVQDTYGDDGMSVDDSTSVTVIDSTFANSAADGLDMDDTESIRLVNVNSVENTDSGFDITAEEHFSIQSVSIIASEFSNNGADGIWIGEDGLGVIVERVSLTSVTANNNDQSGWDINITGTLKLSAVTAEGNGQPNVP